MPSDLSDWRKELCWEQSVLSSVYHVCQVCITHSVRTAHVQCIHTEARKKQVYLSIPWRASALCGTINYPLRSTESHWVQCCHIIHALNGADSLCSMAEDDCLKYMELPSDLFEENFAAYWGRALCCLTLCHHTLYCQWQWWFSFCLVCRCYVFKW